MSIGKSGSFSLPTKISLTFTMTIAFIVLLFFGCKEIEDQEPQVGKLVQPDVIEEQLSLAMAGASPFSLKTGEGALYEFQQKIEGSAPTRYLESSLQVLDTEQVVEGFKVYFLESDLNIDTGEVTKESFTTIFSEEESASVAELSRQQLSDPFAATPVSSNSLQTQDEEIIRITYHDLMVNRTTMAPPMSVGSQPNCAGIPDCTLQVVQISFERADWTSSSDFEKTRFEYWISTDTPYLGLVVKECVATQVPVEGRRYLVENCKELINFQFGSEDEEEDEDEDS